jgi:hypothetical protein
LFSIRKKTPDALQADAHIIISAGASLALIVLLFSLHFFYLKGVSEAKDILGKIDQGSFELHDLVSATLNGKEEVLYLLTCGARNCAGMNPTTREIYYLQQNGLSYFPRPPE